MILRAITLGLELSWPLDVSRLAWAGEALAGLVAAYRDGGHEVQTSRLALTPIYETMPVSEAGRLPRVAADIEAAALNAEVGYVSLGPVRWRNLGDDAAARFTTALIEAIVATETVFGSIEVADSAGIQWPAVRAAGQAMHDIAVRTSNGFGNLRLAAIANCPPDIPFFPAGFHEGPSPSFSIAVQFADAITDALQGGNDLSSALERVRATVSKLERELRSIAEQAGADVGVTFAGVDRSPAPFPSKSISAGYMIEALGVERLGEPGSLAAAMLLTRALRGSGASLGVPATDADASIGTFGFSGLMLPLLEDLGLARRAEEGLISWTELLLYSSVCGTGLDTIPLPGDMTADQLASIVLDVAALSTALHKPLTCRLMPVPGLRAGDRTAFDFPYFVNTIVLDPRGAGAGQLIQRALEGPRP